MSLDNITSITDIADAIRALNDKTSALESELSACKSEVSRLNRVNSRLAADNTKLESLVKQLEAEIEKLGGKRVEKDSTNSSIPPSQQSIAAQAALRTQSLREPTGRKSGGQEGHVGHELAKTGSPFSTEHHRAVACPHCGAVIPEDAAQECTMTTQMVEIGGVSENPVVTEHRRYTAVCPRCHRKAHGKMPTGSSTKTSYGPKTQAVVVYLFVVQSIPYNRIAEMMRDVFGLESFSEGTVKNILSRNSAKAQAVYLALLGYIAREKCAGMDETGVYINKALCWFWCLQCAKYCFVFADPSRGIEALKKHGILEHLTSLVLCTDRHSTYFNVDVLTHQFCLVHLIRNLQYLNDLNERQQWSRQMQQLFRDAIHEGNEAGAPPGTEVRKKYEERLDKLLDEDVGHYGKDFQALQNGIIKCRDFLFTFLDHEGVPHHNNASEAAIRILKVKAKVSGGFRTQDGADEFAVFHSIADTAKRNGRSKFGILYQLITEEEPNATFIEKYIV
jgi:hypothetical protein